MKIKLLLLSLFLLLLVSCSKSSTNVFVSGSVEKDTFHEVVEIDKKLGLVFMPVSINGKEYNFLFDTGAPLSISEELQKELKYEVVKRNSIRDSDKNKKSVDWVMVDSLEIGGISFANYSAFVGDFRANPILKCLEIDGIVGSNLIKDCNWTIDQLNDEITLHSSIDPQVEEESLRLPFKYNRQYSMHIDFDIGKAELSYVLVDYGSNGGVQLSDKVYDVLIEKEILSVELVEKGSKQSGIVGKAVEMFRRMSFSDSVVLGKSFLPRTMIRTGKSSSVGNRLLKEYRTTISPSSKSLLLTPIAEKADSVNSMGFTLGYSSKGFVYVQSVYEGSSVEQAGVKPFMKVVSLNDINFETGGSFCDYILGESQETNTLVIREEDGNERQIPIKKISK